MTHLQLYARTLFKAILLSVQEMIEELQLQLAAVVGVEMGPVLDAVHFEPFVLGGGTDEALEISARMQGLPAPIRRGQKRRFHLRPDRRACAVIVVVQRMGTDVVTQRAAIARELRLRQRFRPAHQLAMHA